MKPLLLKWTAAFLVLCLIPLAGYAESTQETSRLIGIENKTETGPSDSYVSWPVFLAEDGASPLADALNQLILDTAHIPSYLQMLPVLQEGGTGVRVTYKASSPEGRNASADPYTLPRYCSMLFSAEGKMLSGRPSQVYYPLTVDTQTGETVPFEALFSDPEGAKEYMEAYLEDTVEPALSTYLENNQLFPVPYERFFLDGFGRVLILYENSQLSFLSGFSGAVSFRYSELWDWLDTSPDGVPMQTLYHDRYGVFGEDFHFAESNGEWLFNDSLYGLSCDVALGDQVDAVLSRYHQASDTGFYPGGAYLEMEEAELMGAKFLTDETETTVTGILAGRVDHFGIETGKTSLSQAEALMEREPDVRLTIPDSLAEMYLVCPGTASVYIAGDAEGRKISFTLYADDKDIIQYIKLALE